MKRESGEMTDQERREMREYGQLLMKAKDLCYNFYGCCSEVLDTLSSTYPPQLDASTTSTSPQLSPTTIVAENMKNVNNSENTLLEMFPLFPDNLEEYILEHKSARTLSNHKYKVKESRDKIERKVNLKEICEIIINKEKNEILEIKAKQAERESVELFSNIELCEWKEPPVSDIPDIIPAVCLCLPNLEEPKTLNMPIKEETTREEDEDQSLFVQIDNTEPKIDSLLTTFEEAKVMTTQNHTNKFNEFTTFGSTAENFMQTEIQIAEKVRKLLSGEPLQKYLNEIPLFTSLKNYKTGFSNLDINNPSYMQIPKKRKIFGTIN